jgi:putative membrane protein
MQDHRSAKSRRKRDNLKGMAAGLIGGLVASAVMNQFQALWAKVAEGNEKSHGAQSLQQGSPEYGAGRELQQRGNDEEQDNATERVASLISERFFDHRLTNREKEIAGAAVHYAFGMGSGGLYGVLAEAAPKVTKGVGLPFGAFVWLSADEGMVPLLGLSKGPTAYPLSTHVYALASHLVYGMTTEIVRRAVRRVL